uniref:TM2 domain-containing protein 3 n=1 Tax=Petromyzon marinus TaxID=7757 RepID=A0AAJ7U844_PETMA|nr:TM2 domain-containing protein 3 [Petromyzon marinus]
MEAASRCTAQGAAAAAAVGAAAGGAQGAAVAAAATAAVVGTAAGWRSGRVAVLILAAISCLSMLPGATSWTSDSSAEDVMQEVVRLCPADVACRSLPVQCLNCTYNSSCVYGHNTTGSCSPRAGVHCTGPREMSVNLTCGFCWQLPPSLYHCTNSTSCPSAGCPRARTRANCTALPDVHCLGERTFMKMLYCDWTGGHKWATALTLSVTLGGFGADRFYLGQWREGLGKLFSFGGLGVWTLLDVLLIAIGYIGPADGSLYI